MPHRDDLQERLEANRKQIEEIRENALRRVEEIRESLASHAPLRPRMFSTVPRNRPPSSIPKR